MNPQLALLLVVGLVAFLLWLEHKESVGTSVLLWVPTVWMLICGSRPLASWSGPGTVLNESVEAGSPMDRLVLTTLMILALAILWGRKMPWARVIKENFGLLLFLMFAGVSMLWSDYPFVSFKRWLRVFGQILVAAVVLTDPAPLRAFESVFRRCAYVLIPVSLLLIKYCPTMA